MRWRSPALATAAVVVAAFCWGLSAIFAKGAFESGIPPERMARIFDPFRRLCGLCDERWR